MSALVGQSAVNSSGEVLGPVLLRSQTPGTNASSAPATLTHNLGPHSPGHNEKGNFLFELIQGNIHSSNVQS